MFGKKTHCFCGWALLSLDNKWDPNQLILDCERQIKHLRTELQKRIIESEDLIRIYQAKIEQCKKLIREEEAK